MDGVLPPVMESSYFQNKRVRLKRGDLLHIKLCETATDASNGTSRPCCQGTAKNCVPQRETLRLDARMGKDALFLKLRVELFSGARLPSKLMERCHSWSFSVQVNEYERQFEVSIGIYSQLDMVWHDLLKCFRH